MSVSEYGILDHRWIFKVKSQSAWMNKVAANTYQVGEKLHALFLHFKTERYDYTKYNGKSGYSIDVHNKNNPPKGLLVMNDLLTKIGDRNLEKYLILNTMAGKHGLDSLRSYPAQYMYDYWIDFINSKAHFNEKCENHLLSNHYLGSDLSGNCNWSSDRLGDYVSAFVGCATTYNSGSDSVATLGDAFAACFILAKKPEIEAALREEALNELLLNKILKIKSFINWWCLI